MLGTTGPHPRLQLWMGEFTNKGTKGYVACQLSSHVKYFKAACKGSLSTGCHQVNRVQLGFIMLKVSRLVAPLTFNLDKFCIDLSYCADQFQ